MELAQRAATTIAELTGVERHDIALTLGSGWGKAADVIGETVAVVPAEQVPGFHLSGVPGHSGTLRSIRLASGKHALIIGAHAGAVFLVTRSGVTTEGQINESIKRLNHAGISPRGVLFNDMALRLGDYRSQYGGGPQLAYVA